MRKTKRPVVSAFAKKSCVTATQVALAVIAAPTAFAQQAEVQKGERIEITGSRIPSPNLESASPVAVISAQDIKFEGVNRIEDMQGQLSAAPHGLLERVLAVAVQGLQLRLEAGEE